MKIVKFSAVLSIMLMLFSCSKEQGQTLDQSDVIKKSTNVFDEYIVKYEDENGNLHEINQQQYYNFVINTMDVENPEEIVFSSLELKNDSVTGDDFLLTVGDNGSNSFAFGNSVIMNNDDGYILIGKETCECESVGCSTGCEVQSMCNCTACFGGSCTKTHTLTTDLSAVLFSGY